MCLTGTRDIERCGVFPFRFLTFIAARVGFAEDRRERLGEAWAELFVVGDVEACVERLVREPAVGVAGMRVSAVRVGEEPERVVEECAPAGVVLAVLGKATVHVREARTDAVLVPLEGVEVDRVGEVRGEQLVRFCFQTCSVRRQVSDQTVARDAKRRLTKAWGELPRWNESQAAWVERVTQPRVDADPRVVEAEEQRAATAHALHTVIEPNPWPTIGVYARVFGDEAVRKNPGAYVNARPARQTEDATRTAQHARAEAETLRALTPAEAVERIKQTRAAEEARRETARALAERERQLPASRSPHSSPSHDSPSLSR